MVLLFAGVVTLTMSGCDKPLSGGPCDPIGKTKTDSTGQVWTCAKNLNTGNGYWYKGKP
jgi:hypothetical protein